MKRPRPDLPYLNDADERNQLADLVAYSEATGKARPGERAKTLRRFRKLLEKAGVDDGSIVLQEHWAVLHEAEGDHVAAARHREREARLVRRLFAIGGPVGSVDHHYLAAVLSRLCDDYEQAGDPERAGLARRRLAYARRQARDLDGE